ncbi:uncharacterized protein LOC112468569 [Temnothorax curvispinosus]|uniref:Uncharacterized protein LOC112462670 n=2 Tax=Temnothorax TaxID=300110 RepID=A0A6J1QTT4_9HYME|nr:uncharacterized protein LOC112462670 [Temnothorax curvispinosus]XP_024893567.1 uncharacterized protein LOC112468569 [Temnothorax curvispinosus]
MEISEYLKLPVTDCQNKWQRLREKFSREKKRRELETRSGSGASTRPTFLLYNNMKFLDSLLKAGKLIQTLYHEEHILFLICQKLKVFYKRVSQLKLLIAFLLDLRC